MATRLIIDGNAVYEIDEDFQECLQRKNGSRSRNRRARCVGEDPGNREGSENAGTKMK